mmetsp:Transcript_7331/g.10825  ORF Transcript_7331/g.10825 Transcript_7331/m.10825 type:complete len:112 (-) Transcript_7331:195-530(-)
MNPHCAIGGKSFSLLARSLLDFHTAISAIAITLTEVRMCSGVTVGGIIINSTNASRLEMVMFTKSILIRRGLRKRAVLCLHGQEITAQSRLLNKLYSFYFCKKVKQVQRLQ